MSFKVFVYDNFHFKDASQSYEKGEYASWEEALHVCKLIVDENLLHNYTEGISSSELYELYTNFGEDPFIVPMPEDVDFFAWGYAKHRCEEICENTGAKISV